MSRGEAIRPPTTADGWSADAIAKWHDDMRKLDADPRTTGSGPRPQWLVRRVLGGQK